MSAPAQTPGDAPAAEPPAPVPGPEAVRRASEEGASPRVQATALAYFMGEEPPPGRDDRFVLNVDFGRKGEPNFQPVTFRRLGAEELDKCAELAQDRHDDGRTTVNSWRRWCYVFAYACVSPDLGQVFRQRQEAGTAGEMRDTSGLVAEVFRWQPGVLSNVVLDIESRSRLGEDKERSVVEVEAGKGSS